MECVYQERRRTLRLNYNHIKSLTKLYGCDILYLKYTIGDMKLWKELKLLIPVIFVKVRQTAAAANVRLPANPPAKQAAA